jgi:hypothetical protein
MRPGELPAESNLKLSRLSVRPDERPLRPVELGWMERIGYQRAPWAPAATAARIDRTHSGGACRCLAGDSVHTITSIQCPLRPLLVLIERTAGWQFNPYHYKHTAPAATAARID